MYLLFDFIPDYGTPDPTRRAKKTDPTNVWARLGLGLDGKLAALLAFQAHA